ncbi:3-deoxy-7-phosphoheptulonate synthase [Pseudomonas sp. Irchel s3h17]|uniref:3-deoxy-7-phosphoheptulonate synthase n=1 Tax=Pseudomonas sp. Irchel s3h17 TaxID=2009182 RepID=UPI000BA4A546|nr:3-deoxy-7-phosphoheptulonate synthase [Pseudomonas sp. Irchel s3h17]
MNSNSRTSPSSLSVCSDTQLQLPSTLGLKQKLPITDALTRQVQDNRNTIRAILNGEDERLLVIVGPCSLHHPDSALEYAEKLLALAQSLNDEIFLVMRTYIEKPRTTVGWKGLAYDPWLNGSNDVHAGLEIARILLRDIVAKGLPIANEVLHPIAAGYFDDLMSWAAVGARTTESQVHRELVSGLGIPVGFKNGTDGGVAIACDAMRAAAHQHTHFGVNSQGVAAVIKTDGNPDTHLVLRGGIAGPNYDRFSVATAKTAMDKAALPSRILVDCSHSNSGKSHTRQPGVFANVLEQRLDGEHSLKGMMLESHLYEGCQVLGKSLRYGVSVTDACLGWDATEASLTHAALTLAKAKPRMKVIAV